MYCQKCGTLISDDANFCNSCGAQTSNTKYYISNNSQRIEKGYNTISIFAFVLGIISWFRAGMGIFGLAAIILGCVGLSTFKPAQEKNKWMAITGIVMGSLSILYVIFALLGVFFIVESLYI